MHTYDYKNKPVELLTPEIVILLGTLRECKGRQDLFIGAKTDVLTHLLEVAKIQDYGQCDSGNGY